MKVAGQDSIVPLNLLLLLKWAKTRVEWCSCQQISCEGWVGSCLIFMTRSRLNEFKIRSEMIQNRDAPAKFWLKWVKLSA